MFESTVTSGVLWCAESWALREADKQLLKTTQNKMLRNIVGIRRYEGQTWVDWITSATRASWKVARDSGVRFWLTAQADMKWRWAGHVARTTPVDWLWSVTSWRDDQWAQHQIQGSRPLRTRAGRWTRWEDSVKRFVGQQSCMHWRDQAQDRDAWRALAQPFAMSIVPGSRTT